MNESVILQAEALSIGYRTGKQVNQVHQQLNFQLYRGELTCLLGANGTGKSTLLRTLSASQPALGGKLLLQGRPLESFTERERSQTIGVVLTDKTFSGGLTVYELVALGRQPHTGFFGRLHREDHILIEQALEQVGIAHKRNSYTAELSDGERQKVMIAKALVQECPLILLDEPTAFLDVVSRIEIMQLLHRLANEQQKAILLSTHDIEQALILSDRLWLLSQENGLQCGVTEDLILQHRMDHLFQRKEILFDALHGVYYPQIQGLKPVVVEADDPTLLHWGINALQRKGYRCLAEGEASQHVPHLRLVSPTQLIWNQQGDSHTLSSFEELQYFLTKE